MIDTVKLHYSEAGQGTPVVLLHGFPLSSVIWRKQQEQLSDLFRVITPDLRGHGRSPAPRDGYEMEALAGDVFALLDDLGISRAAILGHSMGGYVALAGWKLAPERFLALGLVDSHAGADTNEARQGRLHLAERVAADQANTAVAAGMLPKLFMPGSRDPHPLADQIWEIILATPEAGVIGGLRGMAHRPDSGQLMATINVPVLVLTGDSDQMITPDKAREMAAVAPDATLAVIEKSGHLPMMERPEATTEALSAFLSAVSE